GSNSDGSHVTRPDRDSMAKCMRLALKDAQISPEQIGYVNAHGTATDHGDIAESLATKDVFGKIAISSLKSYFGHTLGACGAIEAWLSIEMLRRQQFVPTLNLKQPDPQCAELDYIVKQLRCIETDTIMSNNFAFGGINTSLIFKRYSEH
ncbi:MAG: beta-ketoacyl-ACP synthase, partial [Acinetobacter sp.]